MRAEFFQHQVERLRKVYSPAAMNEERSKILWEKFKGVPDHVFENALNHLIGECTTQALPAVSRIAEAVANQRGGGDSREAQPYPFKCPPCSDLGLGWVGHTIVACSCATGRSLSPEQLAKEQANYDKGRKLFPSPFDADAKGKARLGNLFHELPYDPSERLAP